MGDKVSKEIVRWVCGECGSNNMNPKSLAYQCMICGKIQTTENVIAVNRDAVIDSSTATKGLVHIKKGLLFSRFMEMFALKSTRIIQILSMVVVLIFLVYLVAQPMGELGDKIYHFATGIHLKAFPDQLRKAWENSVVLHEGKGTFFKNNVSLLLCEERGLFPEHATFQFIIDNFGAVKEKFLSNCAFMVEFNLQRLLYGISSLFRNTISRLGRMLPM